METKLYEFEKDKRLYFSFYNFNRIFDIKQLKRYDSYAENEIKNCENLIEAIKQYRKDLTTYSQNLLQKEYHLILKLIRKRKYFDNKIFYYITISKVYDTGEALVSSEKYTGKERHIAFKRFEELKKLHPGIAFEKNI